MKSTKELSSETTGMNEFDGIYPEWDISDEGHRDNGFTGV